MLSNQTRTRRPGDLWEKLPDLCQEVRDRLAEGGAVIDGAPVPLAYREAVEWLRNRLYLRTERYQSQQWAADTSGLDPDVFEFVVAFRRFMERLGIPTHADVAFVSRADQSRLYVLGKSPDLPANCAYCTGRAFSLVHSVRGRGLPSVAWEVFHHAGCEVAAKLGLGVQWGGAAAPWQWIVDP